MTPKVGDSGIKVIVDLADWFNRVLTFSTYSKTRYSFPLLRKASFNSTILSCLRVRSILSSRSVVSLTSSFSVWRSNPEEIRITCRDKDYDELWQKDRRKKSLLPSLSLNFLMATISLVSCNENTNQWQKITQHRQAPNDKAGNVIWRGHKHKR